MDVYGTKVGKGQIGREEREEGDKREKRGYFQNAFAELGLLLLGSPGYKLSRQICYGPTQMLGPGM